jgi:hypothetical protein
VHAIPRRQCPPAGAPPARPCGTDRTMRPKIHRRRDFRRPHDFVERGNILNLDRDVSGLQFRRLAVAATAFASKPGKGARTPSIGANNDARALRFPGRSLGAAKGPATGALAQGLQPRHAGPVLRELLERYAAGIRFRAPRFGQLEINENDIDPLHPVGCRRPPQCDARTGNRAPR